MSYYIAFDLGAESGRAIKGEVRDGRLVIREVHRFLNTPVPVHGTIRWDVLGLLGNLREGLRSCARDAGADPAGVGVDTWGVDFGLLDESGELLTNPVHYRDRRTEGMIELACEIVGREQIYAAVAARGTDDADDAGPDALLPLRRQERGVHDRLHEPATGCADAQLVGRAVRVARAAARPSPADGGAGNRAGDFDAGDSARMRRWVTLSCGTWSVMGIEIRSPRTDRACLERNFANEGAVDGKIRLLKNIMGLWVLQECRRSWAREGQELDYATLTAEAAEAAAFPCILDIDDAAFYAPEDMRAAIAQFCARTGQRMPEDRGALVRAIIEGIALRYRAVLGELEEIIGRQMPVIHMVGGGTQNRLLCQMAADATGRPVVAGPVEATAIGNIVMQMVGTGELASVAEGRELIRRSVAPEHYEPRDTDAWDEAFARYAELTARG